MCQIAGDLTGKSHYVLPAGSTCLLSNYSGIFEMHHLYLFTLLLRPSMWPQRVIATLELNVGSRMNTLSPSANTIANSGV